MMGRNRKTHEQLDPEWQRWLSKYPKGPSVAECVRLIHSPNAGGVWNDCIAIALADHAAISLPELIDVFRNEGDVVALYVMMAIEIAKPPEAIPFLTEVLREGDIRFTPYAERTLKEMNMRESRKALWEVGYRDDAADHASSRDHE